MAQSSARSGGIGFLGLLCLLFIALKLTGQINWSWWWVLAPIWIPWSIFLGGMALFFAGALIYYALESKDMRQRRQLAASFRNLGAALERRRK